MGRDEILFNIKYHSRLEGEGKSKGDISPIRGYQMEYCLKCEEEGKCDYDRMMLCIAIREFDYAKELYGLKAEQMKKLRESPTELYEHLKNQE